VGLTSTSEIKRRNEMKKVLKTMDYNEHKYWAESSDLTEAEKIQMAKDLRELESRGVIEFRDGRWGLAAGEIEETPGEK
jgi:hypothetical protein